MKKNKRNSRIFSRVLAYLSWATAHRLRGEHATAYREVTAAKRLIADFGGEDVKVVFYDREWHIQFTVYRVGYDCIRYYTVSASHGYTNDYHNTNKANINTLISTAEFARDWTLRRDFCDYQIFLEIAESVLYAVLTTGEFSDYCRNGEVSAIPYDLAIRLCRELHSCSVKIANEAVAHKKVVL